MANDRAFDLGNRELDILAESAGENANLLSELLSTSLSGGLGGGGSSGGFRDPFATQGLPPGTIVDGQTLRGFNPFAFPGVGIR